MKNTNIAIAVLVCIASLLTGCNQTVTASKDKAYFDQHLEEAKQVNSDCLAKGPAGMSEAERATCKAAGDAWQFQPYKPTGGAWSSKGGKQ